MFRESTGELVLSRRGLADAEIDGRQQMGMGQGGDNVFYRAMLRGPSDSNINIGGTNRSGGWTAWATRNQLAEPFRQQQADHLKSGEWVRLVAINRATGYVGTQRVQLTDASTRTGGMLSFPVDDIKLMPPNLKIWAERTYDVDKGLTSGEERRYLIGAEGASQTSDAMVTIYSEWLDQDGRPLPEGLGDDDGKQYGLTGRLAKVVAPNQLGAAGSGDGQSRSDLASFPIAPGLQKQVIQLRDNQTRPEHYYVHVTGTQVNENPSFDAAGGAAEAPLDVRPVGMTPFLTPLFDEDKSLIEYNAYRDLKRNNNDVDADKPIPYYAWSYRPEYQFSRYSLEMQEVNRTYTDASGADATQNIYTASEPIVSASDKFVELLYSLMGPEFDRLTAIDGPQDLVFAFGEEEAKVEIGEDKKLKFENLDHLSKLDVEDFLTLRLYSNQDAGNILWEYAFELFVLDTQNAEYDPTQNVPLYISADDPVVDLQALLVGFYSLPEDRKTLKTVRWDLAGLGHLETGVTRDDQLGAFFNKVTLPPVKGAAAHVTATLDGEPPIQDKLPPIIVIPGKPARIEVVPSGKAHVKGVGAIDLKINVYDAHNNFVSDGTAVSVNVSGDALVSNEKASTSIGEVRAAIRGYERAEDITATITVGDIKQEVPLTIHPLTVEWVSAPAQIAPDSQERLKVKLTDSDGNPAWNIAVTVDANVGLFDESFATTNGQGEAEFRFVTPNRTGETTLLARACSNCGASHPVRIAYFSNTEPPAIELQRRLVVGDESAPGTVNFTRYDGVDIPLPYETRLKATVRGVPNGTRNVTIGDLFAPNRNFLAAYFMNDVIEDEETLTSGFYVATDEVGLLPAKVKNVLSTSDGPHFGAGSSFYFEGRSVSIAKSVFDASDAQHVQKAGELGFSVRINPALLGGEVFDLGNGFKAQFAGNSLRLSLQTSAGSFKVDSDELVPGQWYKVAGRYSEGELAIQVGDVTRKTPATGDISYNNTRLQVGSGYTGYMKDLLFFDWASQPLYRLENGQETMTVSLDDAGQQEITLLSQGALNKNLPNASVKTQSINVVADGFAQSANVFSKSTYAEVAGEYATNVESTQVEQQYPLALNGLTLPNPPDYVISPAHAGVFDMLPDWAGAALDWVVPFNDIKILFEQIGYLATGDMARFDAVETVLAGLGVLSAIPVAKPLKVVLGPLRKFYRSVGNRPFVKAMAGVISRYGEHIKKRDFDKVTELLPFFLVVAEMIKEPEVIGFMINSIASADDLMAWIDYLNLPADGWEGEGAAPRVNVAINEKLHPDADETEWLPDFSGFIPVAYADSGRRLSAINPAFFVRRFKTVLSKVGADLVSRAPEVSQALRATVEVLNRGEGKQFRRLVFNPKFIAAVATLGVRAGANHLRAFLKGKSDARLSPLMVMAIIAFLEEQYRGNQISGDVYEQVIKKYALAFGDVLTGDLDEEQPVGSETGDPITKAATTFTNNGAHGALFHLQMVAFCRLLGLNVEQIEAHKRVKFYTAELLRIQKPIYIFDRNVDIVLLDNDKERWLELKSLKSGSSQAGSSFSVVSDGFSQWGYKRRAGANVGQVRPASFKYHKQFTLDRAAAASPQSVFRVTNGAERPIAVADYEWWFQQFKARNSQGRIEQNPKMGGSAPLHPSDID